MFSTSVGHGHVRQLILVREIMFESILLSSTSSATATYSIISLFTNTGKFIVITLHKRIVFFFFVWKISSDQNRWSVNPVPLF